MTAPAAVPRRRRGRVALVIVALLVVLLAIGVVVAESVVRTAVAERVAEQFRTALELPAEHPVDVAVGGGPVLLQLVRGRLEKLDVASDDVELGDLRSDLRATLESVPIDGVGETGPAEVVASIDAASVRALAVQESEVQVDDVTLDPPLIRIDSSLEVFGFGVPVAVGLRPSVDEGGIALAPEALVLAGQSVSVADLRSQFGSVLGGLLDTRTTCIADAIPVGLTLTGVEVTEEALDATFTLDPALLSDPALQEPGTCP